jgi:hypothetical protein
VTPNADSGGRYAGIRERVTRIALAAYDEATGRDYPHSFALQRAVDATVAAVFDELENPPALSPNDSLRADG